MPTPELDRDDALSARSALSMPDSTLRPPRDASSTDAMAQRPAAPPSLQLVSLRTAIDAIDDALMLLAGLRGGLAQRMGRIKLRHALPVRCAQRERAVRRRAAWLGRILGVSETAAEALMQALIDEACRAQAADPDQGASTPAAATLHALRPMSTSPRMNPSRPHPLLRLLPPPTRWAPLLARVPPATLAQAFQAAAQHVLSSALAHGDLAELEGRVLGIEISDLGLGFVVQVSRPSLRISPLQSADTPPEASVRGSCTDLLLLASRLEDADSLFFQRRLSLTGDTELGLIARNLLDQLPWEQVPLPLRIVLNRCARLARAARAAHQLAAAPAQPRLS